jgi:tRNA(fMet)-specific endonuclease VapC
MSRHLYLLDTNIVSDLVRNPKKGKAAVNVKRVQEHTVCTSIVVACELRFGAIKKESAALAERLELILRELAVLPLEGSVDEHYGSIRAHLERIGQPIGGNDLLIAAHARQLGLTLVTANTREFGRVPGLVLENWLIG